MRVGPDIYILDANLLLRLADASAADHATAQVAVKTLRAGGAVLRTIPQAVFEFWVVATRSRQNNGLGLNVNQAEIFVDYIIRTYWPVPDDPALLTYWRRIVTQYGVVGKNAHDARYVASMLSHGFIHLLTFDSDFHRYSVEGILVVDPATVPSLTRRT